LVIGARTARGVASPALVALVALCTLRSMPSWSAEDHFAATERARYAALCRAHKDLGSCSDAVRWSPGDPVLVATLADALVRAHRLPEALRDYQHARSLQPGMPGLDTKISALEARLNEHHVPRKAQAERAAAGATGAAKHYSNADPETQSH
jgi:hypothetical protein